MDDFYLRLFRLVSSRKLEKEDILTLALGRAIEGNADFARELVRRMAERCRDQGYAEEADGLEEWTSIRQRDRRSSVQVQAPVNLGEHRRNGAADVVLDLQRGQRAIVSGTRVVIEAKVRGQVPGERQLQQYNVPLGADFTVALVNEGAEVEGAPWMSWDDVWDATGDTSGETSTLRELLEASGEVRGWRTITATTWHNAVAFRSKQMDRRQALWQALVPAMLAAPETSLHANAERAFRETRDWVAATWGPGDGFSRQLRGTQLHGVVLGFCLVGDRLEWRVEVEPTHEGRRRLQRSPIARWAIEREYPDWLYTPILHSDPDRPLDARLLEEVVASARRVLAELVDEDAPQTSWSAPESLVVSVKPLKLRRLAEGGGGEDRVERVLRDAARRLAEHGAAQKKSGKVTPGPLSYFASSNKRRLRVNYTQELDTLSVQSELPISGLYERWNGQRSALFNHHDSDLLSCLTVTDGEKPSVTARFSRTIWPRAAELEAHLRRFVTLAMTCPR
jgi:hypothetical protein